MTEELSKKILLKGASLETTEKQSGFMVGIGFIRESVWHYDTELPNEDKCVLTYNPETDNCEVVYAALVGKGCRWAYLEDLFTEDMAKAMLRHEKEVDERWRDAIDTAQ
jgi:hypothetical protein